VKFDIGDFFEKLSSYSIFCLNRAKISGGLNRAKISGGLNRAKISGGLNRAKISGGLNRAKISGGLRRFLNRVYSCSNSKSSLKLSLRTKW
jgi:hypothetical protein